MGLYCTVISVYWNLWFVFGFRVEAPCASRQYAVRGSASGPIWVDRFLEQGMWVSLSCRDRYFCMPSLKKDL
eukprot:s4705_g10.t1